MQRIASIRAIVEEHAENAAFFWLRRSQEINGQDFNETDIGRLDQRLDASLAGLRAAGAAGWDVALARFGDYPEAGEVFVLGVLGLESGDVAKVDAALDAGAAAGEDGRRGMSGAVARTTPDALRPFVASWLSAAEPGRRYLGVCALSHHRIDPGRRATGLLDDPDASVRARALRLIGELGARHLLPLARAAFDADTAEERFWAAWSACLLGASDAAAALERIAETDPDHSKAAIAPRLIAGPAPDDRRWLRGLIAREATRDPAIAQIGVMGDRSVIPWLIESMRLPERAEAAGKAFRDLFEIDFNDTDLFTSDPASLGDAFAAMESGTFPIADQITAWWDDGRGALSEETAPSMRQHWIKVLRAAVAVPGRPLGDWRRTRRFPAWM